MSLQSFPARLSASTSFLHCVDFPTRSHPSNTSRAPLLALDILNKSYQVRTNRNSVPALVKGERYNICTVQRVDHEFNVDCIIT